jgi:hypothetical protein
MGTEVEAFLLAIMTTSSKRSLTLSTQLISVVSLLSLGCLHNVFCWKIPMRLTRRRIGDALSMEQRRRARNFLVVQVHANEDEILLDQNSLRSFNSFKGTKSTYDPKHSSTLIDDVLQLKEENMRLREALNRVETENERLHQEFDNRIILETFEGEGKLRRFAEAAEFCDIDSFTSPPLKSDEMSTDPNVEEFNLWRQVGDNLEVAPCPAEPKVFFGEALRDRSCWLVGLLFLQSCSGIILARNEALLVHHPVSEFTCHVFLLLVTLQYSSAYYGCC